MNVVINKKKFLLAACLICLVLAAGCHSLAVSDMQADWKAGDGYRIWMLSDIQPRDRSGRRDFELAVKDMVELEWRPDLAVIAGDLLQSHSDVADFNWFLQTRNRLCTGCWFEIAGNHDARNAVLFERFFRRPAYYGIEAGNLLLLMLSDETGSSATNISNEAFAWWRDMVINHQDKIIITVTHGQLRQSGLLGSFADSRVINDSDRFVEVLRRYRVALWVSGHMHLPGYVPGKVRQLNGLGGTVFLNVSAIRNDRFMDTESRLLLFKEGSGHLLIRSRNHSRGRFDRTGDLAVTLQQPFRGVDSTPNVILPEGAQ